MIISAEKLELGLKTKLFRGFADTSRLAVLEALRAQPLNVSEIVQVTGLSQSNISNHLRCLRDCGLVINEQRGRNAVYQLSSPKVNMLLDVAEELLSEIAQSVYDCTRYETVARPGEGRTD